MSVYIIDDVPFGSRRSEKRPHVAWMISEKTRIKNHRDFLRKLTKDPGFARCSLVAAHIGDPYAEWLEEAGEACELVALEVCARGGRILFFSGEKIEHLRAAQRKAFEKAIHSLVAERYIRGWHFDSAYWPDVEARAVRRLLLGSDVITADWRIDCLLRRLSSPIREVLAMVEALSEATGTLSDAVISTLRGVDRGSLRQKLLSWHNPGEDDAESIEKLLAWIADLTPGQTVPPEARSWITAVRRTLQPQPTPEDEFERARNTLSHALFGNAFAEKFGPDAGFLEGYWRALSGSPRQGDEDSKESVERALYRWRSIHEELTRFASRSCGVKLEGDRRKTLVDLAYTLDLLVDKAPRMARENEEERNSFQRSILAAIDGMRDILRSLKLDDGARSAVDLGSMRGSREAGKGRG